MGESVVRWLGEDGSLVQVDLERLEDAADAGWVWIDCSSPTQNELETIATVFGLHPLLVEDVLHAQVRPKIDVYSEGLFVVWIAPVRFDGDGVEATELEMFVGSRLLLTAHAVPLDAIAEVASDPAHMLGRGTDWLAHAIIDRLVDRVLPLVDELGDELEDLEDLLVPEEGDALPLISGSVRHEVLRRLHAVRRRLLRLHRIVGPERDVVRTLARERDATNTDAYRYFEDVGDHLARVEDAIESHREVAAEAMDMYLSAQSNRMNEIMKALTVAATILGALTVITGIYGMNFRFMPELGQRWGYPFVLVTMAITAGFMAWFFKRRDWW